MDLKKPIEIKSTMNSMLNNHEIEILKKIAEWPRVH